MIEDFDLSLGKKGSIKNNACTLPPPTLPVACVCTLEINLPWFLLLLYRKGSQTYDSL